MKTKIFALAGSIAVAAFSVILTTSCKEAGSEMPAAVKSASVAAPAPVKEYQTEPFTEVDEMPLFPGGEEALLKYIGDNINYPEKAKKAGVQGRVIVRFAVSSTGAVERVEILKGADPDLDAEATRVISKLPVFKPGKKDGVPVDVWYAVPITFSLRDDK